MTSIPHVLGMSISINVTAEANPGATDFSSVRKRCSREDRVRVVGFSSFSFFLCCLSASVFTWSSSKKIHGLMDEGVPFGVGDSWIASPVLLQDAPFSETTSMCP